METIGNGELGDAFRKGLKQIEDWETWLYASLYETFIRYKHPHMLLEDEFRMFDRTRMHLQCLLVEEINSIIKPIG